MLIHTDREQATQTDRVHAEQVAAFERHILDIEDCASRLTDATLAARWRAWASDARGRWDAAPTASDERAEEVIAAGRYARDAAEALQVVFSELYKPFERAVLARGGKIYATVVTASGADALVCADGTVRTAGSIRAEGQSFQSCNEALAEAHRRAPAGALAVYAHDEVRVILSPAETVE